MEINIKKLTPHATLPHYAHPGDAGMDVFSAEDILLAPGARKDVSTGIAMQIPEGAVGLVWDKSGRALKEGLKTMAGVIDAGYRGEVRIVLVNLSTESVSVTVGQKIAQILIQSVISPTLSEVRELDDSSRGHGGFGSTGI